jgi:hypothetical protein
MIKLGTEKKAPQRLPLAAGAAILYRPLTAIEREAALATARRAFEAARDGVAALADYGLDEGVAWQDDADLAFGVATLAQLVEMGLRAIVAWEGIVDAEGKPVPVTRANLAALLRDPLYFTFVQQALNAPILELSAEGNGSASSPNGAPAGASTTAQIASDSGSPAPAESAGETASAVPNKSAP